MLMMYCVVRDYDGEVLGDVQLQNSRGWGMKRQRPLAQGRHDYITGLSVMPLLLSGMAMSMVVGSRKEGGGRRRRWGVHRREQATKFWLETKEGRNLFFI
jgi:hypothetical protein